MLKLIGDPERRYREDPVRMLRAVRLAAKLGFSIDDATAEPIPRLAPLLREAAPARLFEECLKLFLSGHGVQSFLGLEAHGLLAVLFPEAASAPASPPPVHPTAESRTLVQPVRAAKRQMIRHPFELYMDQLERLRELADEQRRSGGVGSMSRMVRDAIDRLLDEQSPTAE